MEGSPGDGPTLRGHLGEQSIQTVLEGAAIVPGRELPPQQQSVLRSRSARATMQEHDEREERVVARRKPVQFKRASASRQKT